jgi:hypothetical protein
LEEILPIEVTLKVEDETTDDAAAEESEIQKPS